MSEILKAPVCLTVWVIWPLNPSMAVKEDFEPEVSNNIEQANEAGKLAFPPAFAPHISLFPAALLPRLVGESCVQTGTCIWDSELWGILFLG